MDYTNIQYEWSGISKQGKKAKGILQAHSINLAKMYLSQQGITPITIRKKRRHPFRQSQQKIQDREITIFFRQLSTLIQAGIPIVQCCNILSSAQHNLTLQSLINTLKTNLEAGKELSFSLRQFPAYFDAMSYHLIYLSEQTGKLDHILLQIANHKEKKERLKNQLQQALLYPAIITFVATLVTLIMLIFVVPRFADLFQTLQGSLPVFTKCIIQLSTFILEYYWLSVFPVVAIVFFKIQYQKSKALQEKCHAFMLKLPYIGNVLQKTILTRFSKNLATALSAGIPIMEALQLVSSTLESSLYEQIVKEMRICVATGQSLCHAMQKANIFPELMIQLTQVGETSGQLANMLEKIAATYEAELDNLVSRLSTLLEPLIITILGALIGCVLIALYLPIFKLGTVI